MGLPIFREPTVSEIALPVKPDSSAHARSSIRRQASVRRRPHHAAHRGVGSGVSLSDVRNAANLVRSQSGGLRDAISGRLNPSQAPSDLESRWDMARATVARRQRLRGEPSRSRNAHQLLTRQPNRPAESPRPQLPFSQVQTNSWTAYAPALPISTGMSGEAWSSRPSGDAPIPASQHEPASRLSILPPLSGSNGLPPLRRMDRRSISDWPAPPGLHFPWRHNPSNLASNGLGDRQRSWSPDSDEDQWETLLTTITPDPSLPSAESSFTSASASFPISTDPTSVVGSPGLRSQPPPPAVLEISPYCDDSNPGSPSGTVSEYDSDGDCTPTFMSDGHLQDALLLRQRARLLHMDVDGFAQRFRDFTARYPASGSSNREARIALDEMQSILGRLEHQDSIFTAAIEPSHHSSWDSLPGQDRSTTEQVEQASAAAVDVNDTEAAQGSRGTAMGFQSEIAFLRARTDEARLQTHALRLETETYRRETDAILRQTSAMLGARQQLAWEAAAERPHESQPGRQRERL